MPSACRLRGRGRERRRPGVSRPGDARGGGRLGDYRLCRLAKPDGPLRDKIASAAPRTSPPRRSARPMDRQGAPAATENHRARHGFEREPDLRWVGGRAYNGHFGCTCYHSLSSSTSLAMVERCALRPDKRTAPMGGARRWSR